MSIKKEGYTNIFALPKAERIKRAKWHCPIPSHKSANGLRHPACYDKYNGLIEKIGYLDIETSNLSSDFGCILSYCIKEDNGKIIGRALTPKEIKDGIYDKDLLGELCADLRKFTRVITYYGGKFDIPFIRSRALLHHKDFPKFGELLHTDAYMTMKFKFRTLHSRRLGVVAPFYGIESKGHPLNPTVWLKCLSGNLNALRFVFTHNKEDVVSLEKLWHKVSQFTRMNRSSV